MRRYPGGGAFALFFHPHPREFATQDKKSANARGLARGGGGWAQLELTDALGPSVQSNIRISLFLKEAFSSGPEGLRVINENKWNIHCFEMWNI